MLNLLKELRSKRPDIFYTVNPDKITEDYIKENLKINFPGADDLNIGIEVIKTNMGDFTYAIMADCYFRSIGYEIVEIIKKGIYPSIEVMEILELDEPDSKKIELIIIELKKHKKIQNRGRIENKFKTALLSLNPKEDALKLYYDQILK